MKPAPNQRIASILRDISILLEMDGVAFKPRAYEKAANGVEFLNREAADLYKEGGRNALEAIPGVGASIAEKIEELIATGKLPYYDKLKKKYPIDLQGLDAVEGIGPKHMRELYMRLKVKSVADIAKAAASGDIATIPGLGGGMAEKIRKSIRFLKTDTDRHLLLEAITVAERLIDQLKHAGANAIIAAGSIRRMKDTIGDIDLVATAENSEELLAAFARLPDIADVEMKSKHKVLARLASGFDADLLVVPQASWGAAILYFTGSRDHTLALRNRAIDHGYTLTDLGLFTRGKKQTHIAGSTEESVYSALGLAYIPPELREDRGEIAAAENGTLPELVGYDDLKGDLQVQTSATDGTATIADMASAAKDAGLAYIAITDHTASLAMARGQDANRIRKQMDEIAMLNKKLGGKPHVLCGAEVNISKDGSLDTDDDTLAVLDIVGASVHSHMHLSKKEQTARIIRAMEHPHVDILFHPTARKIGTRPPMDMDMQAIIAAAVRTGTILEINCKSSRLDLHDIAIRDAMNAGCYFAIDSDAHHETHFGFLRMGIGQARRGWATKERVVNALPLPKLLALLKKPKEKRFRNG